MLVSACLGGLGGVRGVAGELHHLRSSLVKWPGTERIIRLSRDVRRIPGHPKSIRKMIAFWAVV